MIFPRHMNRNRTWFLSDYSSLTNRNRYVGSIVKTSYSHSVSTLCRPWPWYSVMITNKLNQKSRKRRWTDGVTASAVIAAKILDVMITPFSTEACSVPIKEKLDVPVLYQYLNLHKFSSQEIDDSFTRIQSSSSAPAAVNSLSTSHWDFITLHHIHQFLIHQTYTTLNIQHTDAQTQDDTTQQIHQVTTTTRFITDEEMKKKIYSLAQDESYRFLNTFQPIWQYSLLSQEQQQQDTKHHHKDRTQQQQQVHANFQHDAVQDSIIPSSSSSSFKPPYLYRQAFITHVQSMASTINYTQSLPIAINMFVVGSSVGMIVPMMPWLVYEFGLSTGQYGWVVGSFAIAKCLGNIPSTIGVERYGRKPMFTYSLIVVGCGVGMMGLSTQFEHLILCRLCTGLGVAALSTAATLSMTDISTTLNRASTMAPIMSSFAAGTALGPALGGIFADTMGVHSTFYVVGCCYVALAMINRTVLNETQVPSLEQRLSRRVFPQNQYNHTSSGTKKKKKDGLYDAVRNSMAQWVPLLSDTKVRNVVLMNGIYWVALAGSQMTILPLFLTDPSYGFALSATQVGKVYMGMSLVQVLGNPILAKLIDKMGKTPAIVVGCTLLSSTMFALPFCTDMTHLATTLGLWALGSTLLSTAPVSYLADKVPDDKRAQAVALLRTAGDVGLLAGASASGAIADFYSMDFALHSSSALLLTTTFWFATRYYLSLPKVP